MNYDVAVGLCLIVKLAIKGIALSLIDHIQKAIRYTIATRRQYRLLETTARTMKT
tara:strand:+ start:971 stop:1135 length:165 start_codon:yes stop_codon:yes gene_type:complete